MGISLSLGHGVRYHPGLFVGFLMLMFAALWALVLGTGYIMYVLLIWPTRTLIRRYG